MFERMKKKYGITNNFDLCAILAVYSLAGSSITFTVRPLYRYAFHVIPHVPFFLRIIAYICVALPVYQCFLLIYGFLFGQFKFFWEREKKLGRWIKKSFTRFTRNISCLLRKQESEYIQQ